MTTLETLGRLVRQKRADQGVRSAAKQIGISHATLSRIEHGHLPDLENFQKVCTWLGVEMSSFTGMRPPSPNAAVPRVHFRKEPTVTPETAHALAQLILAAQAELLDQEEAL